MARPSPIGIPGDSEFARDAEGVVHLYDRLGNHLSSLIGHPLRQVDETLEMPQRFGRSLAMDNEYLVVGQRGATSIFERYGNHWGRVATFTGNEISFGRHVDLTESTIAVGAPDEPVHTAQGSVHVFEFDPELDAFDEWRRNHFGNAVVNNPALEESVWSPHADPDGDGVSNLGEAYHGTNPLAADAALAALHATGDGAMTLHWRTRPANRRRQCRDRMVDGSTSVEEHTRLRSTDIRDSHRPRENSA